MQDRLDLSEILALERQFLRDREIADSALRTRDRRIGRELPDLPRIELFRAWLERVEGKSLHEATRVAAALRLLQLGLVLAGISCGVGTSAALLRYDGAVPINLFHFLGVLVFGQLGLLLVGAVGLGFWRKRRGASKGGVLGLFLGGMLRATLRFLLPADRRNQLLADLHWLRLVGGWYGEIEAWSFARLTQLFALAFNLAALAWAAGLMATSDLSFVWRSTIDWPPGTVHRVLGLLALPWAWLFPQALPDPELVAASHHFRGSGAPLLSPERLATWWSFLLTALLVYGLLPRLFTWAASELGMRRALRNLRLDRGDFQDLFERLTLPLVEMPAREGSKPQISTILVERPAPAAAGQDAWLIVWKDAPVDATTCAELVQLRLGKTLERCLEAGGGVNPDVDAEVLGSLAGLPADQELILLAEDFESPTRELLRFLAAARAQTPVPFVLFLVHPQVEGGWVSASDEQIAIWRKGLGSLRDPHLRVVSTGAAI